MLKSAGKLRKFNLTIKSDRIFVLRKQYDAFLEEDKKRKERNEYILGCLDKMRYTKAVVPSRSQSTHGECYATPSHRMEYRFDKLRGHEDTVSSIRQNVQDVAPARTRDAPQRAQENNLQLATPTSSYIDNVNILNEISKKYILIPKLKSMYPTEHVMGPSHDIIPHSEDKPALVSPLGNIENNDWKSKYDILETLKSKDNDRVSTTFNGHTNLFSDRDSDEIPMNDAYITQHYQYEDIPTPQDKQEIPEKDLSANYHPLEKELPAVKGLRIADDDDAEPPSTNANATVIGAAEVKQNIHPQYHMDTVKKEEVNEKNYLPEQYIPTGDYNPENTNEPYIDTEGYVGFQNITQPEEYEPHTAVTYETDKPQEQEQEVTSTVNLEHKDPALLNVGMAPTGYKEPEVLHTSIDPYAPGPYTDPNAPNASIDSSAPEPYIDPNADNAYNPYAPAPTGYNNPNGFNAYVDPNAPSVYTDPNTPMAYTDPNTPMAYTDPNTPMAYTGPNTPMAYTGPNTHMAYSGPNTPMAYTGPNTPIAYTDPNTPMAYTGPNTPMAYTGPNTPMAYTGPNTPMAYTDPNTPMAYTGPNTPMAYTGPNTPMAYTGPNTPMAYTDPNTPMASTDPNTPMAYTDANTPKAYTDPNKPMAYTDPQPFGALSDPNATPDSTDPKVPNEKQNTPHSFDSHNKNVIAANIAPTHPSIKVPLQVMSAEFPQAATKESVQEEVKNDYADAGHFENNDEHPGQPPEGHVMYDQQGQAETIINETEIDNTGIEEFEAEQRDMFYKEDDNQAYTYNQDGSVNYNAEYGQPETYQEQGDYAYYQHAEQEAVGINEQEEITQQYDQSYQDQYAPTYQEEEPQDQQPEAAYEGSAEDYKQMQQAYQDYYEDQNPETVQEVERAIDREEQLIPAENVIEIREGKELKAE